jgi:hypothetical protein
VYINTSDRDLSTDNEQHGKNILLNAKTFFDNSHGFLAKRLNCSWISGQAPGKQTGYHGIRPANQIGNNGHNKKQLAGSALLCYRQDVQSFLHRWSSNWIECYVLHTLTSFIIMIITKAGWLRRRWALRPLCYVICISCVHPVAHMVGDDDEVDSAVGPTLTTKLASGGNAELLRNQRKCCSNSRYSRSYPVIVTAEYL